MIPVPQSDEDYAKLHLRSYLTAPVTPAEFARRTSCRCERRGEAVVEVERIEQYGRPLTVISCINCGKPIPGFT